MKRAACEFRQTQVGKRCFCVESKMGNCAFYEAIEGLPGMCAWNLDTSEKKGSPEEITDFCFNREARSLAKLQDNEH